MVHRMHHRGSSIETVTRREAHDASFANAQRSLKDPKASRAHDRYSTTVVKTPNPYAPPTRDLTAYRAHD